jgi:uncharacterized repeat protein (TIGR02543 family)
MSRISSEKVGSSFRGFAFALLTTLLVFTACDLISPVQTGRLVIRLSSAPKAKTLVPDLDLDVVKYDISGVGPGDSVFTVRDIDGTSYTEASLLPGTWTITASGKNTEGTIIVKSPPTDVTVTAGQTATASLNCIPVAGNGSFSLSLSWPAEVITTARVEGNLVPETDQNQSIPLTFTLDGTTATCSTATLANGYYMLTVKLFDTGKGGYLAWSWNESVLIYKGESTDGNWTLQSTGIYPPGSGNVTLTLTSDAKKPISVTLSGSKTTLASGETMTVTATGTPTPDSWKWYLDGDLLSGQSGSSVTVGSGLLPNTGHSLVAVAKKGDVTGSAGLWFSVASAYLVTYSGNGNTTGTAPTDTASYKAGDPVILAGKGDLAKTGYTFTGWNSTADGTGTTWQPGASVSMPASNLVLYAKWEVNSFANIGFYEITATRPEDSDLKTFSAATIKIINRGPANLVSEQILEEYYLSSDTTAGNGDDIKIGEIYHTLSLEANYYITIPLGSTSLSSMTKFWTADNVPDGSYHLAGKVSIVDGYPTDTTSSNDSFVIATPFTYTGAAQASALGMQSLGPDSRSVSSLNDAIKYSLLSFIPDIEAEGSGTPVTSKSYSLTSTTLIAPNRAAAAELPVLAASSIAPVYGESKLQADEEMRAIEERLLNQRHPQLDRTSRKDILPSAPATIAIGTAWNGVQISMASTTIDTTCRHVSNHAYFFVDNRNITSLETSIASYAAAFDSIYHVNREKFGTENDVDGNGKIIIVITQAIPAPAIGYFAGGDKYPKSIIPTSNEGDIFYMSSNASQSYLMGTLAHEFQHMIYFDEHYNRGATSSSAWLNEALSQAAEYYNDYQINHISWMNSFLLGGYKGLSLTYWTSSNYGYGAIFIRYLIDRFGDAAIRNMCATAKAGIDAVESATGTDFTTIFSDFSKALALSGTGVSSDPDLAFSSLNLATLQPTGRRGLLPVEMFDAGETASGSLYPYEIRFDKWVGSLDTMTLAGTELEGTMLGLSY